MNKKFKRLISVILTVMMAIGMMPFSGLTTVSAATLTSGTTIYFSPNTNWASANATFAFISRKNNKNAAQVNMSKIEGTNIYQGNLVADATNIQFLRLNPANGTAWNNTANWPALETGKNLYTLSENTSSGTSWDNYTGSWSTYSDGSQGGGGTTTPTDNKTVYFDTSGNSAASWPTTGSFYVYGFSSSGSKSGVQKMYTTNKSGVYGYTFDKQYESVIFLNKSSFTTSGTDYSSQTTNQTIPWSTYANPTFKLNGGYETGSGKKKGTWSNNSDVGTVTELTERFLVATDLVDFVNDARLADDGNLTRGYSNNNQGSNLGKDDKVYGYLNEAISQGNYTIPLYFGNLLLNNQRHGNRIGSTAWTTLKNWSVGANVALEEINKNVNGTIRAKFYGAAAQGLVGTKLNNGRLTDPNDYNKILPYFSGTSLKALNSDGTQSSKNVTEYYKGLEFPFKQTVDSHGVTTYSYNSDTDKAVYYDWKKEHTSEGTGNFYESDTHILNDTQDDDTAAKKGFFPLNRPRDSDDARNMGFGVKFSIPFTLASDGMINGQNVSFNFTGDDDVWVFIDNYLVLDMGGAHRQATGKIDFTNKQVTVDYAYTPDRSTSSSVLGDGSGRDNETSSQSLKSFSAIPCDDKTFADIMADDSKPHTLTMFYMERGMFDSNMSVSFNMDVLPSGLTLAKEVNVADVNEGLKNAVKDSDDFDFTIKANSSLVNGVTYEKESGDGTITEGKITGVKDGDKVSNFKKGEDSAFAMGTSLNIVENGATNYTTSWSVTDVDLAQVIDSQTDSKETTFNLGKADDTERTKVNYLVNFVNTPKVAPLTLTKKWQDGQTPPTDGTYNFAILVDLAGGTDYQAYDLVYTVNGETKTTVDSQLSLKVNETATFEGIPIGASYKIIETIPEGAAYSSDQTNNTVTGTIAADGNAVTFTNKTNETKVNKVIYVAAGDNATTYTPSDGSTIQTATLTSTQTDGSVTAAGNSVNVIAKTPNEKYVYTITGTTSDGASFSADSTLTVYTYKATDKVYVFDYGLKSDIAKTNTNGDGLFQGGEFYNTEAQKVTTDKTSAYLDTTGFAAKAGATNDQTSIAYEYTSEAVKSNLIKVLDTNPGLKAYGLSEGNSVIFTPLKFMDKVEEYTYKANIKADSYTGDAWDSTNPETGTVVNGTIKVMPASVVYYEDNFNADATGDSSVKIIYTGTNAPEGTSLDLTQSNGQTEQYGHDDSYAEQGGVGDSNGTSTKLTADGYNTTATFTFTGTGFDVIARTTTTTGSIVCIIQKDGVTDPVDVIAVDTYYANGDLYQIPVIHKEGLEHGKYTVTLGIKASTDGSNRNVVYLDGIRIYNPLSTPANEYKDNEKDATITKVSDLILGDGQITETGVTVDGQTTIEGQSISNSKAALLTDGMDKQFSALGYTRTEIIGNDKDKYGDTSSLLTYLHAGPNNEVYLNDSGFVGLVVTGDPSDKNNTLQVEAKLSTVGSNELDLNIATSDEDYTVDTVKSASATYVEIPVEQSICLDENANKYLVVIKGNTLDNSTCLSFTNLKVKGYTLANPLDDDAALEYIDKSESTSKFSAIDKLNCSRNKWSQYEYTVTLSEDVFSGDEAQFKMYYVNAKGKETRISVTAKATNTPNKYELSFKAPNAVGTFPVKLYYVVDGVQQSDFISTTINIIK